jgi:acetyl-CoA synthetase
MFEGVPTYPSASRFWEMIQRHKVTIFYTAPTAIRSLMGAGDDHVKRSSRASLKLLGSVGEPINPEAWEWYYRVVGEGRCPIVDTWWQTETGGILITPLPGATALKPGSATLPFFGVRPALVDDKGTILEGAKQGNLVIEDSWPGQSRTVYGDHERFVQTYFSAYKGMYFTGDGCRRDEDGYYWITGRVDDVINVSGHRMGTAEVESALVAHPKVAEAAVVGYPHDLKGQGIYCYVTLNAGEEPTEALRKELVAHVRKEIGPIASPDLIQFAPGLPKTRSGKIMRRILRKIAEDEFSNLGDTSTLADPAVVDDLVSNRQNKRAGSGLDFERRDDWSQAQVTERFDALARGIEWWRQEDADVSFPPSHDLSLAQRLVRLSEQQEGIRQVCDAIDQQARASLRDVQDHAFLMRAAVLEQDLRPFSDAFSRYSAVLQHNVAPIGVPRSD